MVLARIVLSPPALESITLSGVLLATIGTLFLAYDLLGFAFFVLSFTPRG